MPNPASEWMQALQWHAVVANWPIAAFAVLHLRPEYKLLILSLDLIHGAVGTLESACTMQKGYCLQPLQSTTLYPHYGPWRDE